jgi:SAM-dependent methyltransferase
MQLKRSTYYSSDHTSGGEKLGQQYDTAFFEDHAAGSRRSAAVVVPLVNDLVRPKSVLDVGCGVGTWLSEWANQGITDFLGLDGDYVDRAALQVSSDNFRSTDLRSPFSLGRQFDLVESLEVAEHLEESRADAFVQSLANHADTILFSAAIPGQGGRHHVNEQWPSYWIEKFSRRGLHVYDVIRPVIWTDRRIDHWYRQNVLLFSKNIEFDADETRIDVVHPDYWEARINGPLSLRQCISGLPGAIASTARNRLLSAGKRRRN